MTTIIDWSRELDWIAVSQPGRTILEPEQYLWEAFQVDRDEEERLFAGNCRKCVGTDCGHWVRPRRSTADEFPGTVKVAGNGLCSRCYSRARRGDVKRRGPSVQVGQPCSVCHEPLRPRRATIMDHPGTRAHYGHGICRACHPNG